MSLEVSATLVILEETLQDGSVVFIVTERLTQTSKDDEATEVLYQRGCEDTGRNEQINVSARPRFLFKRNRVNALHRAMLSGGWPYSVRSSRIMQPKALLHDFDMRPQRDIRNVARTGKAWCVPWRFQSFQFYTKRHLRHCVDPNPRYWSCRPSVEVSERYLEGKTPYQRQGSTDPSNVRQEKSCQHNVFTKYRECWLQQTIPLGVLTPRAASHKSNITAIFVARDHTSPTMKAIAFLAFLGLTAAAPTTLPTHESSHTKSCRRPS